MFNENKVERWFSTLNGKSSRAVYKDDDYGLWEVIGHENGAILDLGRFRGTFLEVVNKAVEFPGFFNPLDKMGTNIYRVATQDYLDT